MLLATAMRQLTPTTNLVLAVAAAAVVMITLGLPWYAPAKPPDPTSTAGPVEQGAAAVARVFTDSKGSVTGSQAMGASEQLLLGLVAGTAGLCLLMGLAPLRNSLRDVTKIVGLLAPLVVLAQFFGAPSGMELRYGVFLTFAAALLMANSAFHGAELPGPRTEPDRFAAAPQRGSYTPPGL